MIENLKKYMNKKLDETDKEIFRLREEGLTYGEIEDKEYIEEDFELIDFLVIR